MTVPRLVRPIDTIAVEGPRPRIRQIAVPDFVGIFRQRNAVDLANTLRIEETELDPLGVRREHGEVDSLAVPRRTERTCLPRPDPPPCHHRGEHSGNAGSPSH